ncbi:S24 family peptidase [Plasticicumulans acidivorans]|nr:S24 family peptidase [Plasticicumulans acidivorans]
MNTSIEPIVHNSQALIVQQTMRHHEPMVHELDARQAFSTRLHQALDALGLPMRGRATWLHDRTGLSQKAVGKWLNAESMPDTKRLEGLAKLLSVDARWLLSGLGEMGGHNVREDMPASDLSAFTASLPARIRSARLARGYTVEHAATVVGVTAARWEAWERGDDLPPPPRLALISGALGVELDQTPEPTNIEPYRPGPFTHVRRIPVVSFVTAGAWTEVRERLPDNLECIDAEDVSAAAFAVRVVGDSMTPLFPAGTTLVVDPEARKQMDEMVDRFVVARLPNNNEATFKQLVKDAGTFFLKPLNCVYPLIRVTEDCEIVGVVVESRQIWR